MTGEKVHNLKCTSLSCSFTSHFEKSKTGTMDKIIDVTGNRGRMPQTVGDQRPVHLDFTQEPGYAECPARGCANTIITQTLCSQSLTSKC